MIKKYYTVKVLHRTPLLGWTFQINLQSHSKVQNTHKLARYEFPQVVNTEILSNQPPLIIPLPELLAGL